MPSRIALSLVGLTLACSAGRPNPSDPKVRQEVVAAMDHYTALIKLVASDSIAAMYTEDGELLEAGMAPLVGPKAIREFLAQFDGKVVVDSASTASDDVEVFGTTAYQWGSFSQVARVQDQPPAKFGGRYVARWRRTPEGQWKLTRLLMQPAPSAQ
ncbi:MAG TPA: nuclear transport factor 2 family protein [Gemmatimonadales bacterium]|jgi:ketosteroid isomerase-like protein